VLRLPEARHQLQERGAQLLERRERELHLGLDAACPGDPKLARGVGRVLEQGGLADARLSVCHQHAAASSARAVQQPVERLPFAFPAEQRPSRRRNRRRRSGHAS
jgi:hypothetical protein